MTLTVDTLELKAADGHVLEARRVQPAGRPRGGIVVLQEAFGLTRHIEEVARQYAAAGYVALAPALFDRIAPHTIVSYTDIAAAIAAIQKLEPAQTLLDVQAAVEAAAKSGKVGAVGYCWGGTMTYLAACHLPLAAGVSYYGGGLPRFLDRTPKCPVMFHFGEKDERIPLADVERVKQAYPLGHYYLYPAEHGFNCNDRTSYDAPSAQLAFDRSLEFLRRYVG